MAMTIDEITEDIRTLVQEELAALKRLGAGMGIGEDGLKRLALCSLILFRTRAPVGGKDPEMPSNETLMKHGGPIE